MIRRRALALLFICAALLGVASATSLGTLSGLTFWSTSVEDDDIVCEVSDDTDDTTFYTGLLDSLTELSLLDLVLASDVTYIELVNLAGTCTGLRPVVIVLGEPNVLTTDREVLSRTMLDPLSGTDVASGSVLLPVSSSAEVNSLLDLTTATPDEVRLAFCPVGVASCEP